ncbi:MAG: hypothetical protein MJ237_08360 [bacterium]|nr:hypothetical protein [bacterium]
MPAIVPNSTVVLFHNVPLDVSQNRTIYFENAEQQYSYFNNAERRINTRFNFSYIREKSALMVDVPAAELYDCNYLAFKNTSYLNKWFYAFVTSVEYVNDVTTQITFEIDVMQTWLFGTDYETHRVFVEREHHATDRIGESITPENLETGEMVFDEEHTEENFKNYSICVAATFNKSLQSVTGGLYGGVYSGLYYNTFSGDNKVIDTQSFLRRVTEDNKSAGIVSIFMIPTFFVCEPLDTGIKKYTTTYKKFYDAFPIPGSSQTFKPKNNKVYTYPFNYLYCTDNNGRAAEYRYEFFESARCGFEFSGAMSCNPEFQAVPLYYNGVEKNYNSRLTITDFPQCAFATDSYAAWLAQNKASLTVESAGIGISAAANLLTGNVGGLISNGLQVAGLVAEKKQHETLPPQAKGKQSSSLNVASGLQGFTFYHAHARIEFLRIIDDYFSLYGYATNRVKLPNVHNRPYWNYIKTVGCEIEPVKNPDGTTRGVPAADAERICEIFDNGVTFWKYTPGEELRVGDYSRDNSPV